MSKKLLLVIIIAVIVSTVFNRRFQSSPSLTENQNSQENEGGPDLEPHPLSIQALREGEYPGSDIVIEQTLDAGSNYKRYIASYKSEGLKIYGLLTVPNGASSEGGFPAIIFNHGYISPSVYKTTEKYVAYQDAFARVGYITFKSDYRGHGNSEGQATGGYGSNAYTIDVLNAVSSVRKYPGVNPDKLGMWGHSMGGPITVESMVVRDDVKAGVIWAGVVGSYEDLFNRWRRRNTPTNTPSRKGGSWRQELASQYGDPSQNSDFWKSLSANTYLADISGPLQLHHGTADSSVPVEFSRTLEKQMINAQKEVELYVYDGDDHNLSRNLSLALSRSVAFFNKYLK